MIAAGLKDKLMTALQSAVGDLNSGTHPTEAVAKAASAADFNVEQTRRLCETFNTARTLYHFEAKPQEKEANFPLADQQAVLQAVFHTTGEQTKAASVDILPDYTEYGQRELMAHEGLLVEAADGELWQEPEEALPSLNDQARRAYIMIDTQRNLAKAAISDAEQADIVTSQRLTKLAGAITHNFDINGTDAYARFVRCHTGIEWHPMLAKLAEFLPARVYVSADDLKRHGNVVEDRDLTDWKTLFKSSRDLTLQAANLRAAAQTMAKEAAAFETAFLGKIQQSNPGMETDTFDHLLDDFETKNAQGTTSYKVPTYSVADLFSFPKTEDEAKARREMRQETRSKTTSQGLPGAVGEGTNKAIGESAGNYISSGLSSLLAGRHSSENKAITERLKNQQREVLMQDLMINDPFIGDADPNTVAQAYQAIMQIAPEVSTQKEIVRAILRQAIQTVAVGAYDATAWADLEKTIKETAGTLPARPRPEGEMPK